ncbi:MAG TPA: DNA polymerase III subunit beta [Syntrophorhabdaceae bacterium]|nr:DNA polymerase III subunit beta [Syntrophorhabdaceae bacterium]
MKTVVKFEGQKNTIQGECKPREAMEILGLNPREWKVTARQVTDKALVYSIERVRSVALVSVAAPPQADPQVTITEPSTDTLVQAPPPPTIPESEITVDRNELEAVLKVVADVTGKRGLMPVLAMVKIDVVDKDTITMEATDLEVSYQVTIPAEPTVPTAFLVDAGLFIKEVRALDKTIQDVKITVKPSSIEINDRCELSASVTDEFPQIEPLPPEDALTYPLPNLASALTCVLPAVSTDETRYMLTGVFFDIASGRVVATDGFRLHRAHLDKYACPAFTIPRRAAVIFAKYDAVEITFAGKRVSVPIAGGTFITRVIEGDFPDADSVWPDVSTYEKVHFKARDFLDLIPGVLPVSNGSQIKMTINGRIDIEAESESGKYSWHVPADSTLNGGTAVININSKFLVDAIKAYQDSEEIDIAFPKSYGALVVNEQALIMPIRQ